MKDDQEPPLRHIFDLADLSMAGTTVAVEAKGDELARLARWAGVDAVGTFGAVVNLRKLSQTQFAYEAELAADIVQSCVATLEPVETHITRHMTRELHLARRLVPESGELTLSAGDDDVPETIVSPDYDLAAPLLEEFVLAIDLYPRKEGAAFAPPGEPAQAPESPFAVLKALKDPR
jgi:uncharacterized metal-binding protein YceD (DUF177 family)